MDHGDDQEELADPVISTEWVTGDAFTNWSSDLAWTEWTVGFETIGLNHLSTEYVLIPVSATKAGSPYNPTGDVVQFAFMPTVIQVPQSGDWMTGSWDSDPGNFIYPYQAKCLVGPAGTVTLGIGTYIIYIRIQDNPEVPVLVAGQVQIS
jgi:hypothetical protein